MANDTNIPTLYPVSSPALDATPFGRITTTKLRWRLIREGKLRAVRIGNRYFLTEDAIREFIERGGEAAPAADGAEAPDDRIPTLP